MPEALIQLVELPRAVGGCGQRDAPVGMQVIDVCEWQEAVQRSVDRRSDGILAERAERIQLHHLILERGPAVPAAQTAQLAEVQRGKSGALDAAQIAAAALDP